ncbi:hypothetical protein [Rossellomorea marisflavi]|uniref:hypothetical protein n=1 Tax=Rossellomorea marisflavi TaxID=189381 RepID=UPI003FA17619
MILYILASVLGVLTLATWHLTPVRIYMRTRKDRIKEPMSYYRSIMKSRFKEHRNTLAENLSEDGVVEPIIMTVTVPLIITSIFSLKMGIALAFSVYCIYRLVFHLPMVWTKTFRLYNVVSEEHLNLLMANNKLTKNHAPYGRIEEILKKPVVHTDRLPELLYMVDILEKCLQYKEALVEASRNPVENKEEIAILNEKLKSHLKLIQDSRHAILYMVGDKKQSGFKTLIQEEKQQEMVKKQEAVFTSSTEATPRLKPEVEDMYRIANDETVDENTRKLALETAEAIQLKEWEEAKRLKEESVKDSAMASILTARQIHDLDTE